MSAQSERKLKKIQKFVAVCILGLALALSQSLCAQSLINVDFGVGSQSAKKGFAATGQGTNDFWNLFRLYDPKYVPGTPLVYSGTMANLKLSDGTVTPVILEVTNAPGVWGNSTGDPMYDTYLFAPNGSNIVVTISKLEAGRYNFFLYGHADPDASGEQNSIFRIRSAETNYGPLSASSSAGWKAVNPWQEGSQYVVFRDVEVKGDVPVVIEVAPGPNGIAVLNGLQISSKGTRPPRLVVSPAAALSSVPTNVLLRQIRYDGKVSDDEARFTVDLDLESMNTNETSALLFQGHVAVAAKSLPEGVRIARVGNEYRIFVSTPGVYHPKLEVVAKITRAEPWNQISFCGPAAAIASIAASADAPGVELQLLSGTPLDGERSKSRIQGFLSADRLVSLRWQSKGTEVTRKALITAETLATAHVAPAVIKLTTELRYEFLQAGVPRLTIALSTNQALTRLQGEQIRDWKVESAGTNQILSIEFLRPVEKSYALILYTEQSAATANSGIIPPQPLGIERETGTITLFADDALVEVGSITGLRQTSAPAGALAAYRFYGRPSFLTAQVKRIEPVIKVADRVTARLEETRFLVTHCLDITVVKAGIYALALTPASGFVVTEVKGSGVDDWKMAEGQLRVSFGSRVLGSRQLDVQLEQALKTLPPQLTVAPLHVISSAKETAQIGAAAAAGLELKTAELNGLREIPVSQLAGKSDELLAFNSQEGDWKLTLAAERLPARITAEVFNLITVGDGLVGGSATVRYGIQNQGVQQFRLKVPAHWKNIDFTGPNIRGKEQNGDVWTINLQDKAWGAYTLVVTYDYQFDSARATLDASGLHALDAEHETGTVAVTTAASLKIQPAPAVDSLRAIDPTELAPSDRALITRPVLLAYRYTGSSYQLQLAVTRHEQAAGLDAVADRTQLTSVLTEAGEMLTQASFMVKNNDKQFQRFQLPANARFWGCYVNGQASKAEQDGDWILVSLPCGANRDVTFGVDLVYVQNTDALKAHWFPKSLEFLAPKTDVPNTYAEWELYVPVNQRVSQFNGTMAVARGTTYNLHDAWRRFGEFYQWVWKQAGVGLIIFVGVVLLISILILSLSRRGRSGFVAALVGILLVGVLASMLLPSLASSKSKAQRISGINNLKQIGTALTIYAGDNSNKFPTRLDQAKNYLGGNDRLLVDPETGEPYVYTGAGKHPGNPGAILAYSPVDRNGRSVLFADGGVRTMSSSEFAEAMERDARFGMMDMPAIGGDKQKTEALPEAQSRRNDQGQFAFDLNRSQTDKGNALAAPMAAGLRSIRIEIPRNGQPYTFTKVLNLSDEPLSIKMSVISASTFAVARSVVQAAAFVIGLLVFWTSRGSRKTLRMTLGLAIAIGAVIAFLISARALHYVFIIGFPVIAVAALGFLIHKLVPRKKTVPAPSSDVPPAIPPAVAALALLFAAAQPLVAQTKLPEAPSTILSGNYTGSVHEQSAQFEGVVKVTSIGTNQTVLLFGEDVAVQDFTVTSGNGKLLRQEGRVAVLLPQPGTVDISVKFLVKLGGDVSKRHLKFQLPSALSSHLTATIDESEADVEFPTAVAFKRTNIGQQTRVEATIGASDRVEMQWTPRVKRAAEIAATVFAENRSLVSLDAGVVNVRATLAYQISQGELRQARVRLPADHRLLRVEGESIRTWEVKEENGESVLQIDLLKGISPNWRVTVETERILESLPATVQAEIPHALDVKRESGWVALRAGEDVSLSVEKTQELQRVDVAEFSGEDKSKLTDLFTAYRFLKPEFQLSVRAEPVSPQVEATVRNQVRIGAEQIAIAANIDYAIKKAGVFGLKLLLPAGYRLQTVTGENIQQWNTRDENGQQFVDISFNNRVIGAYGLQLNLVRSFNELPRTIKVNGVHPLSTQKITGVVIVSAEAGFAIKTAANDGLVEVPPSSVGTVATAPGQTVLAYKFISSQPTGQPQWSLEIATDVMESWVRAEIANTLTFTESIVSGHAVVRYDIQNAPVKEFRLKIPTNYSNVEITGANIRRRDQAGDEWRIGLQNKVNGSFTLDVRWEESFETNAMEVVGIQALGVERETGVVVIKARPPLQVLEKSLGGELVKIDVREVPQWAGVSNADGVPAVLAYRYVRPGYKLGLEAKRYQDAAVLQALVDQARFTTVIAADGQTMTEMSLSVRNNGLQYLEVELPTGAKIWSAFVAGQPVRPAKRDGRLLLPLENTLTESDAAISVHIIYVDAQKFPQTQGDVTLASPKLDVPLKNARWDLYLPLDYSYVDFRGSMTHSADASPVVQTYSLAEYNMQEAEKVANRQSELRSAVKNVKSQIAAGNTLGMNNAYVQLQDGIAVDEDTMKEVKDLRKKVDQIQSSNFMQSRDMSGGGFGGGGRGGRGGGPRERVANEAEAQVAEQQWFKLQQAQELAVAKVQPLRINLPKRGVHHAFTQVLQTEVKKPLTIDFHAANVQKTSWLYEVLGCAVAFLCLWGCVAAWRSRKSQKAA